LVHPLIYNLAVRSTYRVSKWWWISWSGNSWNI